MSSRPFFIQAFLAGVALGKPFIQVESFTKQEPAELHEPILSQKNHIRLGESFEQKHPSVTSFLRRLIALSLGCSEMSVNPQL